MSTANEGASQRPRRQAKKISRSDDFLDNYDAELEAIESLPSTTIRPLLPQSEGGPRKRGRPRKYPIAPPPPADEQHIKRPRGRPKGSGKHQKAAAATSAAVVMFAAASGIETESGMASCAISTAPSGEIIDGHFAPAPPPPALPYHDFIVPPSTATPLMYPILAAADVTGIKENGSITPHYPPRSVPSPATDSEQVSPLAAPYRSVGGGTTKGGLQKTRYGAAARVSQPQKIESSEEEGVGGGGGFDVAAGSSKLQPEDTPTPRPRSRRKGVVPTKTE